MAEIEHFVNPSDKSHPKFKNIANKELVLFPQDAQLGTGRTIKVTAGEAVEGGIIANQTLAYFIARTQLWLERIGVDPSRLRFRQHLRTEMAHYAADCWDAEIKLCYGWIECVGHADRSCYDLEQHSKKTGIPLVASLRLPGLHIYTYEYLSDVILVLFLRSHPEPILVDKVIAEANKKLIGPKFKLDQKKVITALEALEGDALTDFRAAIEANGVGSVEGFQVTADLVTFKSEKKTISEVKYLPGVIEPSFGIGRILYSVLEHSFSQRNGDENRCCMKFRPCVAPIKVGIFRLINNVQFDPIVTQIQELFQRAAISNKVDSTSGTVGRRYARADELGIPFGITVDFQTLVDDCITVRERDSMAQIRVPISRLFSLVKILVEETTSWAVVSSKYPLVSVKEDDEGEAGPVSGGSAASFTATIKQVTTRGSFSRPNPAKDN